MADNEVEFFLHAQGQEPKVVTALETESLRDVLVRLGLNADDGDGIQVFVGENDEALSQNADDGEDEEEPADVGASLSDLDLKHHRHVHCHRCRRVAVEIEFNGKTAKRRFLPSVTVGTATEWARRRFQVDKASASEFVLQVCNTQSQPRADQHLGELVSEGECSLCFDLVKEITPQG